MVMKNYKKALTIQKKGFDSWFERSWAKRCTKERMLSEDSPLEHVYYKMTKSFNEIKERYPYEALEQCSSCKEYVDKWIETSFSFCDEYGCGMVLCKDCVDEVIKKAKLL